MMRYLGKNGAVWDFRAKDDGQIAVLRNGEEVASMTEYADACVLVYAMEREEERHGTEEPQVVP